MHTDEYEISTYRELDVCSASIKKIKNSITAFEKKYNLTTEIFLKRCKKEDILENKDFTLWIEKCEWLKKWQKRENQYIELLRIMKISRDIS
jgi:hypothetical protein